MTFPTARLLACVPDTQVNNLVLSKTRALISPPVNHAGTELVGPLTKRHHQFAVNVYTGNTRPGTLEAGLRLETRKKVQASILCNPNLQWDQNAIRLLDHITNRSLRDALRCGGWMNPHIYDGTRPELTHRLKCLPSLARTLRDALHLQLIIDQQRDVAEAAGGLHLLAQEEHTPEEALNAAHDALNAHRLAPAHSIFTSKDDLNLAPLSDIHAYMGYAPVATLASQTVWDCLGGNHASWALLTDMADDWDGTLGDLLGTIQSLT